MNSNKNPPLPAKKSIKKSEWQSLSQKKWGVKKRKYR
jgi:hypothetical protein